MSWLGFLSVLLEGSCPGLFDAPELEYPVLGFSYHFEKPFSPGACLLALRGHTVGVVLHGHPAVSLTHFFIGCIGTYTQCPVGRQHGLGDVSGAERLFFKGRRLVCSAFVMEMHLGALKDSFCQITQEQTCQETDGGARECQPYDGTSPLETLKSHFAYDPTAGQDEEEPFEVDEHIPYLYTCARECPLVGGAWHAALPGFSAWQR